LSTQPESQAFLKSSNWRVPYRLRFHFLSVKIFPMGNIEGLLRMQEVQAHRCVCFFC